ncbi:MAG TPA: FAD-dependent oxidoreductase [Candidatus Acidoferrum sp.]|nr:FAD-dependent oxidoreductase [Candidatus Acidoferrum sp.]
MNDSKYVILGGGMVAGYAAKELVERGLKPGELTIVSADTSVPYERPPLSKSFLSKKDSEETIRINPEDFYRKNGIQLNLNCDISSVDPETRRLAAKTGEEFAFEKLIIATGARPRTLQIAGADLRNVRYLRSIDDSKAIRQTAEKMKRVVVIGGGFIAMEVAAVMAQKQIEVVLVLNEDRIWKRLFTPQMSDFFESYYSERGVRILKNATIRELRGDGAVNSIVLARGETIPCEMVVAGIGVTPVTDVLSGSGIELSDGVTVDEYLETNCPGIYAAGDVANYPDAIFGKRRRVEHWDNAATQGQYCAHALTGERSPFMHVPYFFSDVFDLSYEYWGDSSGADQTIHRGDLSSKSFSVWWLRQNRVIAAFVMSRPDEERDAAPKWIETARQASGAKLQDASQSIAAAVTQ